MSDGISGPLWVSVCMGTFVAFMGALIGWIDWADEDGQTLAERTRRKRIWSRCLLLSPLWFWWCFFPGLVAAAGYGLWLGGRALWRMAFPGSPPTDWDGPSQGGGYR